MSPSLEKVAILAGGGALPLTLAQACAAAGRPYMVLAIDGFADEAVKAHPHEWLGLGSLGKAIKLMRRHGCEAMVFAGIVKRPDFSKLNLDLYAMKRLPRILRAARGGDDGLLSFFVSVFEAEGFKVLGAHELTGDLLAPQGAMGRHVPNADHKADMLRGIDVVRGLGALDIGQCTVVCEGLVLAVEAAEGTDAMIARCGDLAPELRGTPDKRRGVFVKLPKPGQEKRVDLPTIGVETVSRAAQVGLAGIAVEAGATLILARDEVIAAADAAGLFVYGFSADETGGAK